MLCIQTKKIKSWANDKPWLKSGFRAKLKVKETAHKSSDHVLYKKVKYDVQREIHRAKSEYIQKPVLN